MLFYAKQLYVPFKGYLATARNELSSSASSLDLNRRAEEIFKRREIFATEIGNGSSRLLSWVKLASSIAKSKRKSRYDVRISNCTVSRGGRVFYYVMPKATDEKGTVMLYLKITTGIVITIKTILCISVRYTGRVDTNKVS